MNSGEADRYDVDDPDGVRMRFSMETLKRTPDSVIMTMPAGAMANPMTGAPTLALLSIVVDTAGSTAVYESRGMGWPVTTELAVDYNPECDPALLTARESAIAEVRAEMVGFTTSRALAKCGITIGGQRCAEASLGVAYVSGDSVYAGRPTETLTDVRTAELGRLLAVGSGELADGRATLAQWPDPMLLNATRHVHGGVASAGLELVSLAAMNADAGARPFRAGSIRVNFIRPFISGPRAHYRAEVVRAGATMAIADATSVGDDGKPAVTARITAYR